MRALLLVLLLTPLPVSATMEEFHFANGDLKLYAEVHLPDEGSDFTGIVLIQGSGHSGVANNWARQVAERFAARGFAVLLPDKRGVGRSAGNWRTAGFEELADDSIAALRALEQHPRVAAGKVGFMGLSQGGHIAPLAAAQVAEIPFVVNVVGSLVNMEEQLYHELRNAYLQHGLDEVSIEWLQDFARSSFDYLRGTIPYSDYLARRQAIADSPLAEAVASWPTSETDDYWQLWSKVYNFDPLPWWKSLAQDRAVPCLVVHGADDENDNVPVRRSAERAVELLDSPNFTLRVYEGSGHAMYAPGTYELREDMVDETVKWLRQVMK